MQYISYLIKNYERIQEYTINQLELVLWVVVIALLIWVPVGLAIARKKKWASSVLSVANTLYCVPSLAMFAVFVSIPFLGLGRRSAIVALALYAMMPMVRNVYQGIVGVDKSIIEAAKGMGMSNNQIMWKIILPLAAPVMFAGFRITAVMTCGIATVASYIGERNLGRLIIYGLSRSDIKMIIVGSLLTAFISVILDALLGLFEKKIVPKGLRVNRGLQ